ncbi:DUF4238 domain-containing protein [Ensifer sp. BR816]|uniref:DUF4238 domain-containing protein n=1 Tax=Rhizobium sp. (strain BR816) TaxID=1057002 RepID=UPI00037CDC79|nr:DUF4238 domain-containing protein [Ensifer sp. BR816]
MNLANPPTKHHYIPAFYLRRWRDPGDGKVTEFTKPYKAIAVKRVTPEGTGYEERLYELRGYEPLLAQQVEERFFKPVDTWASNSLDLIERHGHQAPWTSHSRPAWTRFILSLLLRCPEDIEVFREWWHEDFSRTDEESEARYQSARGSDDPKTFSEYLAGQSLAKKERHQFEIFYSLVDDASVGGKINNMHWRILQTPARAPMLLTSDRPIIRTDSLAGAGGHIALPIGPRLLFIGSHDTNFLKSILKADQVALVKECNRQVVESAARFVYGLDESQRRFVENRFGKSPQPRLMESIVQRRRDSVSERHQ